MSEKSAAREGWEMFPGDDWQPMKYQLIRAPKDGGKCKWTFLSPHIFGRPVHYADGSSTPCMLKPCPYCARAIKRDWKGYAFVMGATINDVAIHEFTKAGACRAYEQYCKYRSLRGVPFTIFRNRPGSTARIVIRFGEKIDDPGLWPKVPDVRETMFGIWGVLDLDIAGESGPIPSAGDEIAELKKKLADRMTLPGQTFISNGESRDANL